MVVERLKLLAAINNACPTWFGLDRHSLIIIAEMWQTWPWEISRTVARVPTQGPLFLNFSHV
jgi:hypothetical protein